MPVDIVVRPGWFTPGGAGHGRGQAAATPLMSFPPPWVFLMIKISGLRTSDFFWFPTWETQSQAIPQSSRPRGLHQGTMRLGKEWWPEERMVLKNVDVSYTGKRKENLLPCLSHPPKDWATVESLGGNWNFSEKWGVGSGVGGTQSGFSQPAARHVRSVHRPTRWCYLSWCRGGGKGVDTGWGRKNPSHPGLQVTRKESRRGGRGGGPTRPVPPSR